MTAPELIGTSARRFATETVFVELAPAADARSSWQPVREVSYSQQYEQTLRLCAGLAARGLEPGDRFAVLLDNSTRMVASEWACLLAGFLWVSINPRSSPAEISAVLADSAPALLVVAARYERLMGEIATPTDCEVIVLDNEELAWRGLLADGRLPAPPSPPAAHQPVRIRYTSGPDIKGCSA